MTDTTCTLVATHNSPCHHTPADPWCPECGMAEMHDGPGGPIVIRHNPGCSKGDPS